MQDQIAPMKNAPMKKLGCCIRLALLTLLNLFDIRYRRYSALLFDLIEALVT